MSVIFAGRTFEEEPEPVRDRYDIILVDCPPSLGLLTVNALAAADEVMIPIQCEYYAPEGLVLLLRTIEKIRVYLNPDLRIGGILLTMHDARTNISKQVMEEVRKQYPNETSSRSYRVTYASRGPELRTAHIPV